MNTHLPPKPENNDNESEKTRFEKELEDFEFQYQFGNNQYNPYQIKKKNQKSMTLILLISILFFGTLFIGMYYYANNHFRENSDNNLDIMYNYVQISVHNYCLEHRNYPMTNQGYVDIDLLRNKGYFNWNVEVDNSNFMIGDKCLVILRHND